MTREEHEPNNQHLQELQSNPIQRGGLSIITGLIRDSIYLPSMGWHLVISTDSPAKEGQLVAQNQTVTRQASGPPHSYE